MLTPQTENETVTASHFFLKLSVSLCTSHSVSDRCWSPTHYSSAWEKSEKIESKNMNNLNLTEVTKVRSPSLRNHFIILFLFFFWISYLFVFVKDKKIPNILLYLSDLILFWLYTWNKSLCSKLVCFPCELKEGKKAEAISLLSVLFGSCILFQKKVVF